MNHASLCVQGELHGGERFIHGLALVVPPPTEPHYASNYQNYNEQRNKDTSCDNSSIGTSWRRFRHWLRGSGGGGRTGHAARQGDGGRHEGGDGKAMLCILAS